MPGFSGTMLRPGCPGRAWQDKPDTGQRLRLHFRRSLGHEIHCDSKRPSILQWLLGSFTWDVKQALEMEKSRPSSVSALCH